MGIHCACFNAVCLCVIISSFVNVIIYIGMFLLCAFFIVFLRDDYLCALRFFWLAPLNSLEWVNFLCSLRLYSRYCADGR